MFARYVVGCLHVCGSRVVRPPAFEFWLFARCLWLVARVLVPGPPHGRPPLFAGQVAGFLPVVGRWILRAYIPWLLNP